MDYNLIKSVEEKHLKDNVPQFSTGDTVRVQVRVVEGNRERLQAFEGTCIGRSGMGVSETFTVRRVSQGVGVERKFLVHSPRIDKIELRRQGKVRRAKLYYLRGRIGSKSMRIKAKVVNKPAK